MKTLWLILLLVFAIAGAVDDRLIEPPELSEPQIKRNEHRITVLLSERKPFAAVNRNGRQKKLDVLLIEKFAQKFNLEVNYLTVNVSLSYIFASKENLDTFENLFLLRYVRIFCCVL